MLHNEFDEFFKDRLKDYPSPVHAGIWRRIRTDWGRRRLFRTRWGVIGGAAVVVVAVTLGYVVLSPTRSMVAHAGVARTEAGAARAGTSASYPAGGLAGRTAAGAEGTAADPATGAGTSVRTSHFAKSISAGSVERISASSTRRNSGEFTEQATGGSAELMSGRSRGRTLSPGGTAVGGRKADGTTAGRGQGSAGQRQGTAEQGEAEQGQGQAEQGRRGANRFALHSTTMPSLMQIASRGAISAKPITLSPAASLRQQPGAKVSGRNSNLHLDIYGSPDIPTKQFALSYTAGARMTMLITSHFSVSAGLQYSKANVKMDSATAILYPRYFNNIDLPVLIGYKVGNDRFQLSVNGGAIFNLFSHAVSPVGWGWPNRTGPSAYLGLDFARAVSDRLSLFAEPYGRCLFTDYKSLLPSSTYTGGALIGIRYNFMRR